MTTIPLGKLLMVPMIVGTVSVTDKADESYSVQIENCRKQTVLAVQAARLRDQARLRTYLKENSSPLHRVIYGYALLRIDPRRNVNHFLRAFPDPPPSDFNLALIDEAFPGEGSAPIFPGDTQPFSYWSINKALLRMAKSGNSLALKVWLHCAGSGAEHIEGHLEDLAEFFSASPGMVIRNWEQFRSSVDEIYVYEQEPKHFKTLRRKYSQLLPTNHPCREEILAVVDRLEADAIREKENRRLAWDEFIKKANQNPAVSP